MTAAPTEAAARTPPVVLGTFFFFVAFLRVMIFSVEPVVLARLTAAIREACNDC
jgi:hypothetical protein